MQNKFQWIIVFLSLFLGIEAHAFFGSGLPRLNELHESVEFRMLMEDIRKNPESLKDADQKKHLCIVADQGKELAADLIISDIIDQVHFMLNKKDEHKLIQKLKLALGTKPIENFLKWNDVIEQEIEGNKNLERVLKKVVVQLYDSEAAPLPFKLDLLRSGRFSRYERQRRINQYETLRNDPEGAKIIFSITKKRETRLKSGVDLGIFPTTRPTVAKYLKMEDEFNEDEKEAYYNQYFGLIKAQEDLDRKNLPDNARVNFKYKFKASRSKPLLIKTKLDSDKEFKSITAQVFNTVHALPYKQSLLLYLKAELEEKYKVIIPSIRSGDIDHIL